MGYYKNISCRLEYFDRDANTSIRLEDLADQYGLKVQDCNDEKTLPGYTGKIFYWSGYTLFWSDQDLKDWIGSFVDAAKNLIGHSELFVDI